MKKQVKWLLLFTGMAYLWFAVFPTWLPWHFPTGGWDWLGFTGVVVGLFVAGWSVIKQQQLNVVPCLDVDAYTNFSCSAPYHTFRLFCENGTKIYNDGYKIMRNPAMGKPDDFTVSANIKVQNKGLSTAFQVTVYLYELISVDGLTDLDTIHKQPIENFYDRICYKNFEYYESKGESAKPIVHDWQISPQYNLTVSDTAEFNMVFDCTRVSKRYHTILKFVFEDIHQNKYHQLMYWYFDNKGCAVLPVSKLYQQSTADKNRRRAYKGN